jgi:hypothetical protein
MLSSVVHKVRNDPLKLKRRASPAQGAISHLDSKGSLILVPSVSSIDSPQDISNITKIGSVAPLTVRGPRSEDLLYILKLMPQRLSTPRAFHLSREIL